LAVVTDLAIKPTVALAALAVALVLVLIIQPLVALAQVVKVMLVVVMADILELHMVLEQAEELAPPPQRYQQQESLRPVV
jgi:glycerol-3-phosphate acyltransferase PlsY